MGRPQHVQKGTLPLTQLHSFIGHNDSVNTVTWNPHSPVQFATASSDRRVVLWDMERLNEGDKVGNEILVYL